MKPILSMILFLSVNAVCYAQDEAPTGNCAPSTKIGEIEYVSLNDAREKLDLFGLQIKNSNAYGYVIGYGGKKTESNEGRNIADEVEEYLISKFKFTPYVTIARIDGGHRERATVELFIKPSSCSANPESSPSLSYDDVSYKEEKEFFDKSIVRKPSSELRSLRTFEAEPSYPPAARAVRAKGKVVLLVLIDEKGQVTKAVAVDGHPLLRLAAENSIKQSVFQKLFVDEHPIKYGGKIEIDFDPLIDKITIENN